MSADQAWARAFIAGELIPWQWRCWRPEPQEGQPRFSSIHNGDDGTSVAFWVESEQPLDFLQLLRLIATLRDDVGHYELDDWTESVWKCEWGLDIDVDGVVRLADSIKHVGLLFREVEDDPRGRLYETCYYVRVVAVETPGALPVMLIGATDQHRPQSLFLIDWDTPYDALRREMGHIDENGLAT